MKRDSFNRDWFVASQSASHDAVAVGPVTLPYDAMLFEPRDSQSRNGANTGFFPGGRYRYSKTFVAPIEWQDRSVVLEFEGVHHRCEVYINGQIAGGRPYGYALFHVHLNEFLDYGADNLIEVVSDNTDEPNSRWYTGSGIYRPVHLLVGSRVHIAPTGLRLATLELVGTTATVEVATTVVNSEPASRRLTVSAQLIGPDGTALEPALVQVDVPAESVHTVRQQIAVPAAALWSPTVPQLYGATVSLIDGTDIVDTAEDRFGVRVVTADAKNGLRINGQTIKLRGAAIHHDAGVIGAHTLDAAEDRRIRLMKAGGFNAIRSAHNPASRALLTACDTHGVLVMDEFTDAWFRPKVRHDYTELFDEWWERDLESLVAGAHNHPSVIMYSIGNEIAETATVRGVELNRMLARKVRQLDPTRLTTNGVNGFLNLIAPRSTKKDDAPKSKIAEDKTPGKNLILVLNLIMGALEKVVGRLVQLRAVDTRTRDAFADLDVAGYNYMPSRYELDARLHPERVIVGTETSPSQIAQVWPDVERLAHVIGEFCWTGWDYIGEAGIAVKPYGTKKRAITQPYPALLAGEPIFDITGYRQTQSYLNEIVWHLSRGPHIAVDPVNHSGEVTPNTGWRSTNSIPSWSWEGYEGTPATVEVYADAAHISLLLNGEVVGSAPSGRDGYYLTKFFVPYLPGELVAIATGADGQEIGRQSLRSAGADLRIQVIPESTALRADGADLAYLPIQLTDAEGILRPLADRPVKVTVTGPALLLGLGSGEAITTEGFTSDSHRTFHGRAQAVLRATHEPGEIVVTVSADGCEPLTLSLNSIADDTNTSALQSARVSAKS